MTKVIIPAVGMAISDVNKNNRIIYGSDEHLNNSWIIRILVIQIPFRGIFPERDGLCRDDLFSDTV
jgi:hypothetical protein